MSGSSYPMFLNNRGVPEIRIAVREFESIGVFPPLDHRRSLNIQKAQGRPPINPLFS
jgi:hypothetical protein